MNTCACPPADSELALTLLQGETAFPELAGDHARIAAQLVGRVGDDEPVAFRADLYLAMACVAGLPAAMERFEKTILPRVRSSIELVLNSTEHTDDLIQKIREKVFLRDSKLRSYRGKGPLLGWTRAIAVRLALELRSSAAHKPSEQLSDEFPALSDDLELRYLYNKHRDAFRCALQSAFGQLQVRERTVLRLHLVNDVSLERIGGMYGANKSSVSRWVAQAKSFVLGRVRDDLGKSLQLDGRELASLIKAVRSQLSISLSQLQLHSGV